MTGGVVRTNSTRRHTRNNNASPYARPSAKSTSGWSLSSFLSYLNPFSSRAEEELALPEGNAASRLAARGQQLQSDDHSRPPSPTQQAESQQPPQPPQPTSQSPPHSMNGDNRTSPRSDDSQTSSSANLKKVQQFLDEKAGRPLNHVELAGLVHLLQNSVEDEDEHPEPFRFSKSPSTPLRGTTPINFLSPSTSEQMVSAAGTAAQGARKTLTKNPMGVYRWQGGGSARPRNRYQSPGFGSTPSRSTIKLVPERPKTDSKRRRIGEDAASSSPQRAGATSGAKVNGSATSPLPTSASAPAALNGSDSARGSASGRRVNGVSTPPATPGRRTTGVKPTTPAVPSPLRQTWGQTESPPQVSSPQPASKPTHAASFMAELIKEVTPPKKPDFANPYEAANPIIRPAPKKQPVRRTRAAAKAEAEAQKKEPELTPQAIIEATVPKGSKRSRPPPELIGVKPAEKRVTSPPARRSTRLNGPEPTMNGVNGASKKIAVTVEEVSDEEQPSPPKKQRTVKSPPLPPRKSASVTVEVEDVEMSSTPTPRSGPVLSYTLPSEVIEPSDDKTEKKRSTSPTPMFSNFSANRSGFTTAKSSAPKAPSKLRFSIQADKDEKMDAVPTSVPVSTVPCSAPSATVSEAVKPTKVTLEKPKDIRAFVAAMHEDELPQYSFTLPTSSPGAGPSTPKARQTAKSTPVSTLPTFDFSKAPVPAPASKPLPGFDWAAAGIKPPSKPAGDLWTCSMCMLNNPSDVVKCKVCDEPRADKPKPSVTQGFNWAAAGMKPPPKPTGGQWTCSVCMLSNQNDDCQCVVCDSPR